MSKQEKYVKRRLQAASLSTVVSISLVLFMLGLVGMIAMTSEKLSVIVKESIGFSVYLKDKVKEVDIIQLQKSLDATEFVKSSEYISKDEAVKILKEELGPDEDFVSFLDGYNPLPASIDVVLNAQYANPDSIQWIEKKIKETEIVKEVVYSKSLVHLVNENVKKISLFILIFSVLLFTVAIALINNTIRLSLYSKRFLIKTMQLVGATKSFIRRPFLIRVILHGIYASIIAISMLIGVLYLAQKEIPDLIKFQDVEIIGTLFITVFALGIIISWLSTLLAVRKYLKLKTDELYY